MSAWILPGSAKLLRERLTWTITINDDSEITWARVAMKEVCHPRTKSPLVHILPPPIFILFYFFYLSDGGCQPASRAGSYKRDTSHCHVPVCKAIRISPLFVNQKDRCCIGNVLASSSLSETDGDGGGGDGGGDCQLTKKKNPHRPPPLTIPWPLLLHPQGLCVCVCVCVCVCFFLPHLSLRLYFFSLIIKLRTEGVNLVPFFRPGSTIYVYLPDPSGFRIKNKSTLC